MLHISHNNETWYSYISPREDPKNKQTTWCTVPFETFLEYKYSKIGYWVFVKDGGC